MSKPESVSRLCPLCESSDITRSYYTETLPKYYDVCGEKMTVSLCEACGFVFQNPIVPAATNADHYVDNTRYPAELTSQMKIAKKNQFEWIHSVAESSGFLSVLALKGCSVGFYEIGASVGALLDQGKKAGWDIAGIEPSRLAVGLAKEKYEITLPQGSLQDVVNIPQPIVAMVHVLEHMPDPTATLEYIYNITEKYTLLCVEVPDFCFPKCNGGYWNAEHVNYFTPETLCLCSKKAGWEIVNLQFHDYQDAREYCNYPVLRGVFLKRDRESLLKHRKWARDLITNQDNSNAGELQLKIHKFIKECGSRVVIFGAGAHTSVLLSVMSKEDQGAIEAVLDSNPQLEGRKIHGHRIDISANLGKYRGAGIIVSSQGYQTQIVDMVRDKLGNTSPILTFY